jgi:hypothetical protein
MMAQLSAEIKSVAMAKGVDMGQSSGPVGEGFVNTNEGYDSSRSSDPP